MKSIFKNLVVAVIVLSTVSAIANNQKSTYGRKAGFKSEVEKNIIKVDTDPTFKKNGNKLFMNLLNLTEGKVILKVIDSDGRIVYEEAIEGKIVVEKAFDFSKAYKDEYTVVVVDKLGTYTEKIEVK